MVRVLTKAGFGLSLLQLATLVSQASAKTCTPCRPKNALLVLLRSEPEATAFCGDILGVATSTVGLTVTPTVVVSVTVTEGVTKTITQVDQATTTTTTTAVPAKRKKRDIAYPEWLPTTYKAGRVSSACRCLGLSLSTPVFTSTATAEAVSVTEPTTVTETATTTYHSTLIVTETAQPPPPVKVAVRIQVFRKTTEAAIGWLYMSSGPAVTSDPGMAASFSLEVPYGVTTTPPGRINVTQYEPQALGFNMPASVSLSNYYGGMILNNPTPPGSLPVTSGSTKYATDIFTVNTITKAIGYVWIEPNGSATSSIVLYRVGGRVYPVGNLNTFNTAFASVSPSLKYEIFLKYVPI